jgi:hypothetical protein
LTPDVSAWGLPYPPPPSALPSLATTVAQPPAGCTPSLEAYLKHAVNSKVGYFWTGAVSASPPWHFSGAGRSGLLDAGLGYINTHIAREAAGAGAYPSVPLMLLALNKRFSELEDVVVRGEAPPAPTAALAGVVGGFRLDRCRALFPGFDVAALNAVSVRACPQEGGRGGGEGKDSLRTPVCVSAEPHVHPCGPRVARAV